MKEVLEVQLDDEEPESGQRQITREGVERFLFKNRWVVVSSLIGLVLVGFGFFFFRAGVFEGTKIEVLETTKGGNLASGEVVVEISGAVQKPGVYKLLASERLERLLIASGGLAGEADREWVEKNLNRAAKLVDGQKIYVPKTGELRTQDLEHRGEKVAGATTGLINLNNASLNELDSLPGIGAVRAQAIIDNRPYSSIEDLVAKKTIPQGVYEKIKEKIIAP